MKKRSTVSKTKVKSKRQEGKKPKQEGKKKIKSAVDQCEDFIMIDGNLYQATTKTQRNSYQKYLHSMRMQHIKLSNRQSQPPIAKRPFDAEEYVRTLSKSQKMEMLKKLQEQIVSKKKTEVIIQKNPFEKFQNELDKVKTQLYFKWEKQSQKIAQSYYNGTITQTQKVSKIQLLQKLKDHKMRVIDCTLNLFRKIWKSKQQDDLTQNQQQLQDILKSLNSFSSFQNLPEPQHVVDISLQQAAIKRIEDKRSFSLQQQKRSSRQFQQIQVKLSQLKQQRQEIQFSLQKDKQFSISEELKLDIKLIPENISNIFGINRDPLIIEEDANIPSQENIKNSEQCYIFHEEKKMKKQISKENSPPNQQQPEQQLNQKKVNEIVEDKFKNEGSEQSTKINSLKSKDDFECNEPIKKFKIPLLMTKDRVEQMQLEKKVKQLENVKEAIDKRVQVQLGWIEVQDSSSFTTLNGVNNYLLNLADFLTKFYIGGVVDNLNTPFGLSVMYKLYNLQNSGNAGTENSTYMVLQQDYFEHQIKQMMIERKVSEYEKIHSKAIFDCFNVELNFYRPYFQVDGEKYPWLVSPQGISFYEVNQDNVDDAFIKTKIRVFEHCSALCGLILQNDKPQSEQQRLLNQKRQQFQTRTIRNDIIQQLKISEIQFSNYDALCKLLISEAILHQQLKQFANILENLQRK